MIHEKYKRKGYCEGPLGFPMREQAARDMEPEIKEAEKNGFSYKRSFIAKQPIELQEGERGDISVITSNSVDRDNEVVVASGADLKQFEANPVITWGHDYSLPPVGRAQWIKFEPTRSKAEQIKAKIEYAPEGAYELADTTWSLVKAGFLKGKSIGFMPQEIGPPSQKEIDKRPELEGVKTIIRKWSLFEVAVATVPANQESLVESVAKGELVLPEYIIESMGLKMPEPDVIEFKLWDWDDEEIPQEDLEKMAEKYNVPLPKISRLWNDEALKNLTGEAELMKRLTGK